MKFFIVLLLLGIVVSGCADKQPTSTPTSTIPADKVKEFAIIESNFKLNPDNITVGMGENIRIIIINEQGTHNLFVEGYDQRVRIVSAGNTQVMEFVAGKAGTFKMWCEVPGHRDLGMEGQLTVN